MNSGIVFSSTEKFASSFVVVEAVSAVAVVLVVAAAAAVDDGFSCFLSLEYPFSLSSWTVFEGDKIKQTSREQ